MCLQRIGKMRFLKSLSNAKMLYMYLQKKITCLICLLFALTACEKQTNVLNVINSEKEKEHINTTPTELLSGLKYNINLPQYDLSCEPNIPLFLIVTDANGNNTSNVNNTVFLDLHLNTAFTGNYTVTAINWTVDNLVKSANTNNSNLTINAIPNQTYNISANIYHTDGQSIGLTEIKFCFYNNGQLGKVVTEKYNVETTVLNQMPTTTNELKKDDKGTISIPNSSLVVICGEICWCWMNQSFTDNAKEEENEFKSIQGTFLIVTP